jgi:hypothetical protein
MYRSFARRMFVLIFWLLLGSGAALAQSGRISGQVSDAQGASIPGASVRIVSQDRTISREVKSDEGGKYSVPYLPPGKYQLFFRSAGFSTLGSPVITLGADQSAVFDAQMSIASENVQVDVTGGGSTTQVDTTSATMSTTLSQKEVTSYGLNGRNFSTLLSLAPGVSNQTGQDEAKVGVAGSAKFSVNGGRVEYNTFEVDGSDVLNTSITASRGQGEPLIVYPSIDAIQEMKVLTADYSALYGKSASGSVLVTTKSGTDKFHGNLYEFLRNEMFNARNYFDQPTQASPNAPLRYKTPLYRRQDFGGTIGGPIFIPHRYNTGKTKTYFFWSEEMRLEKTPVDYNQAVPTMAERGEGTANPGLADFTDVCPTPVPGALDLVNLTNNPDCPYTPAPAGGNYPTGSFVPLRTIPMSTTATSLLKTGLIPEPNASLGCNTTNPVGVNKCYVASVSPRTYWREELFRIDHMVVPTQQLSFRYVHDSWNTTTLTPQWGIVQNSFPTVENQLNGPGLNMELSLAGSLPHNFINRASVSYTVEHITLAPQAGAGVNTLDRPASLDDPCSMTGCPMGYIFNNGFNGNRTPGLMFQGNNTEYGGHGFAADTGYAPWQQANPTYNVRDDASRVFGSHSLQFGVNATLVQQNEVSAVSGANSGDTQGLLTFSNEQSRYTSGNAFADFLAAPGTTQWGGGTIKTFTQDSGRTKYYNRYKDADLYLQDDWHATKRLTVNIGIRASLFGPWYNAKGTAYNWRPEVYSASLGDTIAVNANYGYIVSANGGAPVCLHSTGCPYSLSGLNGLDSRVTNGLVQCGANGVPNSCMSSRLFFPGPRLGLSYDPWGDGKTAIHGGYGLFWEHGTGSEANAGSLIGSAPLVLSETQSNIESQGGPLAYSAFNAIGFSCQGGTAQCSNLAAPQGGATFPVNVTSIPTKAVYSYTQQWSISIQREVHKNMVAQFAYVGTKGTHLTAVRDLNQLLPLNPSANPFVPGQPITASVCTGGADYNYFPTTGINPLGTPPIIPTSAGIGPTDAGYLNMVVACTGNPGFGNKGTSADSVRRYNGFSNIISVENVADSEYSALQATLRETTGPLTLGIAYTWSHSLDDSSDRSSANFTNSLDVHSNHATSDFDQRQLLNISYIYDLPFLRLLHGFTHLIGTDPDDSTDSAATSVPHSDKPASVQEEGQAFGKVMTTVLGGWQLSGITAFQTGTPFSVVNAGSFDGTGPADNAGVGDGLGVGSYVDKMPGVGAHGQRPFVAPGQNEGPLLLNPGAFAAPRGLTFGNTGRNFLNNPSRTNFNMSLLKHFQPFGAGRDLEFRAEAFNVFNHTQFRITDPSNPGNTGNNVVSCYGGQAQFYSAGASNCLVGQSFLHPVDAHDPRILQFGLKASF